jgi:uncharacterized protein (DUF2062 family)
MDHPRRADAIGCATSQPEVSLAPPATTMRGLWRRIREIAIDSDCPERTAAAFAIGVFLSFSPFLGLQTIVGMSLAFALRMSKAAVFIGLWANLPWFMIPWYTLTTIGAAFLLQIPVSSDLGSRLAAVMEHPFYRAAFWDRLADIAGPFFWAFLLGPTIGAVIVGAVSYLALLRVLPHRAGESSG